MEILDIAVSKESSRTVETTLPQLYLTQNLNQHGMKFFKHLCPELYGSWAMLMQSNLEIYVLFTSTLGSHVGRFLNALGSLK